MKLSESEKYDPCMFPMTIIEPQNLLGDHARINGGAVIVRTQGLRPSLLRESVKSLIIQRPSVDIYVVVHGDGDALARVINILHFAKDDIYLLHAPDIKKRGYPINVALKQLYESHHQVVFVSFLDDDDIVYPFFSSKISAALEFTGADVVYAASNRFGGMVDLGEDLKGYEFVQRDSDDVGYVDSWGTRGENSELLAGDNHSIRGWAIDFTTKLPAKEVWLITEGKLIQKIAVGTKRPDVAKKFHLPKYVDSGWIGQSPFLMLGQGHWFVEAFAMMTDGVTLVRLGGEKITVEQSASASGYSPLPTPCLLQANFIPINSFAVRFSSLQGKQLFFDDTMEYLEDWDFLLRMLRENFTFFALNDTLSEFRITSDGNTVTKRFPEIWAECRNRINKIISPDFVYKNFDYLIGELLRFDFCDHTIYRADQIELIDRAKDLIDSLYKKEMYQKGNHN